MTAERRILYASSLLVHKVSSHSLTYLFTCLFIFLKFSVEHIID